MNYFWKIFFSNFTRYFSPPDYCNDESKPLKISSYCAKTINYYITSLGKSVLLPVNVALFVLGLLLAIADDLLIINSTDDVFRYICLFVACGYLILKFDAWKLFDAKNFLKLCYILLTILSCGLTLLPYILLIVYENLSARPVRGGFND